MICMTIELTVTGMTCQGCEAVVEHAVSLVDNVEEVEANRYDNLVVVEQTASVDTATLVEKVEMAGYSASD